VSRGSLLVVAERRAPWIAAAIVLTAALFTMTSDPIGVFYDDAIYALTAKALAEGHGYVYASLPGMPPAIHYPPLWPAILALAWKLAPAFPDNVAWLKLINPVFVAVAAACTVVAGRRAFGLPWWLALGVSLLSFVSVTVLVLTNVLLSEPLFLMLLFPVLLVTERFIREGGARWAAFAAAMAALIVLGRTIAGVVVVATVLVLLLDRRWRDAAVYCVVVGLLLLPWQLTVWGASAAFPDELRGSYGPYLEWVMDGYRQGGWPFLRDVILINVDDAWRMLGILMSPLVRGPVRAAVAAGTLALFLAGLVLLWTRRGLRVTALAVAGYTAVVLSWPFQVERFVWALWPLFMLIAAGAAYDLVRGLRAEGRPRVSLAVLAAALVVAAGNVTYNVRGLGRGWAQSASREMASRAMHLVRYVNADTRLHGKVIASEVAPMVALYTGEVVVPVEMLTTREHVTPKTHDELVEAIERIDRRFAPDAYVLMSQGKHQRALLDARLDPTRALRLVTPSGVPIRAFLLVDR
jgi:hypothetical protein